MTLRRFTLTRPELVHDHVLANPHWRSPTLAPQRPRYNVAPGQTVLSVLRPSHDSGPVCETTRWGLVPRWASESYPMDAHPTVRLETLLLRPVLFDLYRNQRCIIPADGYFKWEDQHSRWPTYIHRKEKGIFFFAGLWDYWESLKGQTILSCAILTHKSNAHHARSRSPVLLTGSRISAWLDSELWWTDDLLPYLDSSVEQDFEHHSVGTLVHSHADEPGCLEKRQLSIHEAALLLAAKGMPGTKDDGLRHAG